MTAAGAADPSCFSELEQPSGWRRQPSFSRALQGIEAPEAFVLDRQHLWLRKRFVVGEAERAKFWQKIENQYREFLAKKNPEQPPARWLKLIAQALPEPPRTTMHCRLSSASDSPMGCSSPWPIHWRTPWCSVR